MERKERFDFSVKKGLGIRQAASGIVLLLAVSLNVLLDYVAVGFDPAIYQSAAYWLQLLTSNAAVVIILFSSRGYSKEKELTTNPDVLKIQEEIDRVHIELNRRSLSNSFEDYVNADNRNRKLTAYKNKLCLKIARCRDGKRGKKRREKLRGLLDRTDEEIEFRSVKYDRVRISTIFSRTKLQRDRDANLESGEGRAIGTLLLNKLLSIIGFGILGASLTFDTMGFSAVSVLKTVIKLFQCAYAWYVGYSDGITFIRGTLLSKMLRRLDYVQQYLEKRKAATQ